MTVHTGSSQSQAAQAAQVATARTAALAPAIFAILFGVLLLYGTGFARADALHNAAHDTRHSLSFACH